MNNENREKNEVFEFTYSAAQQAEIKKIRQKYVPPEKAEDKMEQLRRLDASVTQKGQMISLCVGVISTLILGVGLCCCLVWGGALFVPGILIGIVGIVGAALAYPLYNRIVKKERERIAPEIIRLTDELLK